MNPKTADLLNRLTSSFAIFLCMFIIMNIFMALGGSSGGMLVAWAGIYVGMVYFRNLAPWTAKK